MVVLTLLKSEASVEKEHTQKEWQKAWVVILECLKCPISWYAVLMIMLIYVTIP